MSRILLVDDHEPVCISLQAMIKGMGHETVYATTGKQALVMHQQDPVDVLVTDIFMPDMDGYELIQKFHRDYPEVKVVAMSGGIPRAPGGPYLEVAGKFGAQWLLRKPFSATRLIEIITEATGEAVGH
ncbi:Response regulator receiver protein [Lacunisphaera limnophila]|uniref:Response regulator receiver protein n=1 Tax=Lacunisphaera limnophila TaxID=1838286 RepID=A0A1D8AYG5_9BACT|nr:response regulator [Lacunisphaera limnophila]AOS45939.1 Response regulator receiver protein [Lacunisphaera limnophila]